MEDHPVLQKLLGHDFVTTVEYPKEYIDFLALKLPNTKDGVWIAQEGRATIPSPPAGWQLCRTTEREVYIFNFDTGKKSQVHTHRCIVQYICTIATYP